MGRRPSVKVKKKQFNRRNGHVLSMLQQTAKNNGLSMLETLATFGRKHYLKPGENYNYALGQLCSKIANGVDPYPKEVPLDVALTLQQYLEIGDTKYTNLVKIILPYIKLPEKNRVRKRKKVLLPKLEDTVNQGT